MLTVFQRANISECKITVIYSLFIEEILYFLLCDCTFDVFTATVFGTILVLYIISISSIPSICESAKLAII